MLNDKELKKIRTLLPDNAYQLIADAMGLHKETVRKVLSDKSRYRKDVIDAAFLIIETYAAQIEAQKQKVKELKAV